MATSHVNEKHNLAVTRLWGGERGVCYQINNGDNPEWITLTEEQFQTLMTYQIGSANHESQGWIED